MHTEQVPAEIKIQTETLGKERERVFKVLAFQKRRLGFMVKKMERFNELDLTQDELKRIWETVHKFSNPMQEMDNVLSETLNKDNKI
jgi:hypothetical protein